MNKLYSIFYKYAIGKSKLICLYGDFVKKGRKMGRRHLKEWGGPRVNRLSFICLFISCNCLNNIKNKLKIQKYT